MKQRTRSSRRSISSTGAKDEQAPPRVVRKRAVKLRLATVPRSTLFDAAFADDAGAPKGQERRQRRSSHPIEAACLYLDALRRAGGPPAIVISDGRSVVARSGGLTDAAFEKLARVGTGSVRGEEIELTAHADIYAHRIQIGGAVAYLSTLERRVRRVRDVEASLARIFMGR